MVKYKKGDLDGGSRPWECTYGAGKGCREERALSTSRKMGEPVPHVNNFYWEHRNSV
jgi:hypothetical protein